MSNADILAKIKKHNTPEPKTLYPSSVFNLLFTQRSKAVAEILVYEAVTLRGPHPANSLPWSRTKRLIDRTVDVDDVVPTYIQELEIKDWSGPYFPEFNEAVPGKILKESEDFHRFR